MARSYLSGVAGTRRTRQSEPIPGSSQVENSSGGFAWEVDSFTRLRRFLILGSEGGSYYATEHKLTKENLEGVRLALDEHGVKAVEEIAAVSHSGRAAKQDPAIFALAMAAGHSNSLVRDAALSRLPDVCRTTTALFKFWNFVQEFRGRGRSLKRAVGNWYLREPGKVAYQAIKYRQREGFTHRDMLRLVKPGSEARQANRRRGISPEQDALLGWIARGVVPTDLPADLPTDALRYVEAFTRAQASSSPKETAELIAEYGNMLPWEALKDEHTTDKAVWETLLAARMPTGALLRNLANMTRYGVLTPTAVATTAVVQQLTDRDALKGARIHPIAVLAALKAYRKGVGRRGQMWSPLPRVIDALDEAFYLAFDNVEATGKRYCLALDVSGSMDGREGSGYGWRFENCAGLDDLTPREAASVMAMVTAKTGDPYEVVAFSASMSSYQRQQYGSVYREEAQIIPGLSVLGLSPRQRLDDILEYTRQIFPGGTDASLPMEYALQMQREFDAFVLYTDSETWAGDVHPAQALRTYREQSGINARLVCVNMVANPYSIADPNDPGMLDVVGFDSAAPGLIADFAAGKI